MPPAASPRRPRTVVAALLGLLAGAALALSALTSAVADVDDFTFDSFEARILVSRDADGHSRVEITETIVARFPDADQNRGIVRAIPDEDRDVPFGTEILSVTDADGAAVPYEVERDGDIVQVLTGDDAYVRGVQTYVIAYTQRDSIRTYADTDADELFRDINGTGWEQPFGEVTATVSVDPALEPALTGEFACYRGAEGARDECRDADASGDGRFAFGAADLGPRETLTVAVGFAAGTFTPGVAVYSPVEQFARDSAPLFAGGSIAAAAVGLATLAGALVARRRRADAPGRGVVIAQYEPPRGIGPMQAAHLIGRPAAAAPAGILDAAVAGHVRIVEQEGKTAAFALEYVAPAPEGSDRERVVRALFPDPATRGRIDLDGDTQQLAKRLADLSAAEAARLREEGLTAPQGWGAPVGVIVAGVIAVALAIASVAFASTGGSLGWIGALALPVTAVAVLLGALLLRYRDRVTPAGAPVREHLEGLREYLRLAEADRIRMLQSPDGAERRVVGDADVLHVYERLLPWAVVWGVEKEWADVLATRAAETHTSPGWYSGSSNLQTALLVSILAQTRSSTSATAAWAGSGGSSVTGGSMGGGFAGGGVGGGGGGGR
jgi:uncharacterized membrane protein YgcG